ncbi:MAG: CRISPR-associated endoribonuclease Cas6 [archaeon]
MRLILKLKSNKEVSQREFMEKYYCSVNGFIYKKLEANPTLINLHDNNSFKGFCFGNIYPVKNGRFELDKEYNLVVSSINPKIIETLFFAIKEGDVINLGEGSFTSAGIEVRNFVLRNTDRIETLSIINLTEQVNGKIHAIDYESDKEKYIVHLKNNLIRKYNKLTGNSIIEDFLLFENVEIGKIKVGKYSIRMLFDDNKIWNAIGYKLYFKFNNITQEQLAIFQVCFDAGFGERNGFGMGMMVTSR